MKKGNPSVAGGGNPPDPDPARSGGSARRIAGH